MKAGILEQLERILLIYQPKLIREALWALSNIVSDCEEYANKIRFSPVFKLMVQCLSSTSLPIRKEAVFAVCNTITTMDKI